MKVTKKSAGQFYPGFVRLKGIDVIAQEELPETGYAVIRCHDYVVVAKFGSFPDGDRALMYRRGDEISFVPLHPDDIVGTPTLFTEMLEKAGYRINRGFDTLHSQA